jgi:hypothetical protein
MLSMDVSISGLRLIVMSISIVSKVDNSHIILSCSIVGLSCLFKGANVVIRSS